MKRDVNKARAFVNEDEEKSRGTGISFLNLSLFIHKGKKTSFTKQIFSLFSKTGAVGL